MFWSIFGAPNFWKLPYLKWMPTYVSQKSLVPNVQAPVGGIVEVYDTPAMIGLWDHLILAVLEALILLMVEIVHDPIQTSYTT